MLRRIFLSDELHTYNQQRNLTLTQTQFYTLFRAAFTCSAFIIRPYRLHAVNRCGLLLQMSHDKQQASK